MTLPIPKSLMRLPSWAALLAGFVVFAVSAQTPEAGLQRIESALAQERKSDLSAAQTLYEDALRDPQWGAVAALGLARVLRWQAAHSRASALYESVLSDARSSEPMRHEAQLGLAQIDALEWRLDSSRARIARVPATSAVAAQAAELKLRVDAQTPTRLSASVGQTHDAAGNSDASWQLKLSHQLDMRNKVEIGHASNTLERRTGLPDAPLEAVGRQTLLVWNHDQPGAYAFGVEAARRQLGAAPSEASLRLHGARRLGATWAATASLRSTRAGFARSTDASLGVSVAIRPDWTLGATTFWAETLAGTQTNQMVYASVERGNTVAQIFFAPDADGRGSTHTWIARHRLTSGWLWRAELKHDSLGNSMTLALEVPFGAHPSKHIATASARTAPALRQMLVGVDWALPPLGAKGTP